MTHNISDYISHTKTLSTPQVSYPIPGQNRPQLRFKVPTVWLLVNSDNDIPRGPTGKVDIERLRAMLAGLNRDRTAAR
jgi:hypothetical protein